MSETLENAMEGFLGQYVVATTRRTYKRDLRQAIDWLGPKRPLNEVSRLDISRYIGAVINAPDAYRGRPYAINTRRTKLKILNTFLRWCHEHAGLKDTLDAVIKLPPEPESDARGKRYTPEEVDLLVAFAAGQTPLARRHLRDLALFLFCHDTGARRKTVSLLQREHIDLDGKSVALWNTKRRRWYVGVLGSYTVQVLREWMADVPDVPTAYLWNTRVRGASMTEESVGQIPYRAIIKLTDAGYPIEKRGIHGFRHKLAVGAFDDGLSESYVASLLDNSVDVVRKHYAPRGIPAAQDAARRLAYIPEHRRKIRRFKES